MNKAHSILVIALLGIILASGCIGQSNVDTLSDGLIIQNMYVDPPQSDIQSGEMITVRADVENVGSATARNVVAELVGASWLPAGSNAITTQILGELSPPDPRYGLPGHTRQVVFRLPAPLLPEGQKANFNLKIRVHYDYETTSVVQVQGYGRDRYNTLYQQGKITPPTTTALPVQVSRNVPVTISIAGPDKVIVGPSLYEEYTYQITFRNVGSQVPYVQYADGKVEDGLIGGNVWVLGPGVFFSNCLDIGPFDLVQNLQTVGSSTYDQTFRSISAAYQDASGGDRFSAWYQDLGWDQAYGLAVQIGSLRIGAVNLPDPNLATPGYLLFPNGLDLVRFPVPPAPIKLRQGASVTKSCTLGIVNTPTVGTWANRPEDSFILNTHLVYRYFIDEPVTISVSAPVVRTLPGGFS